MRMTSDQIALHLLQLPLLIMDNCFPSFSIENNLDIMPITEKYKFNTGSKKNYCQKLAYVQENKLNTKTGENDCQDWTHLDGGTTQGESFEFCFLMQHPANNFFGLSPVCLTILHMY